MSGTSGGSGGTSLNDAFAVEVLLREPLKFHPEEVLAAVAEDYPGPDWSADLGQALPVDTARAGGSRVAPAASAEFGQLVFQSIPGGIERDWAPWLANSGLFYPDTRERVARHRSALRISIGSVGTTLAARIEGARRITCLGAIFAGLPACEAVVFPSAGLVIPPAQWLEAAAQAMRGRVPWPQWVHIGVMATPDEGLPPPITVRTEGMAAFNGHELILPSARVTPSEGARLVTSALALLLEEGREFRDGDAIGGQDDPARLGLRHVASGRDGVQADTWVLVHPTSGPGAARRPGAGPGQGASTEADAPRRRDADDLKKRLHSFFSGGGT